MRRKIRNAKKIGTIKMDDITNNSEIHVGQSQSQDNKICESVLSNPSVELDKTFNHKITNYGFADLPNNVVIEILKDGRPFSHFIEKWLSFKYPLKHIPGCKSYDFEDKNNSEIKYDEKTFTRSSGCKFMPSSMIGTGRVFNQKKFEDKCNELIYIIVSNIDFPNIKIKFVKGSELLKKYPKGKISPNKHDKFFE